MSILLDSNNFNEKTISKTPSDFLETIGKKVIDSWKLDEDQPDFSIHLDNINKLDIILNTHPSKLASDWLIDLQNIINILQPEEFAIYGKKICQYMINVQNYQNAIMLETQRNPFEKQSLILPSNNENQQNLFSSFPEWIPTIDNC